MTTFKAKMSESGITLDQAKKLGFKECDAPPKGIEPVGRGILIPYINMQGGFTGHYRYRYLEPKLSDWDRLAKKKGLRYMQPTGNPPRFYYPTAVEWAEVAEDVSVDIWITEGEFKAAKACLEGVACIGLGGVWCWRNGDGPVSDFDDIEWQGRLVYIVFDSDVWYNLDIQKAERALCKELMERGAAPHTVRLVSKDQADKGDKVGLDDFLVSGGDLTEVEATPYEGVEELHEMNEVVSFCHNPHGFYVEEEDKDGRRVRRMRPKSDVVDRMSNRYHTVEVVKDGTTSAKRVQTFPKWLTWSGRSEVKNLVYIPGGDRVINGNWNTWTGWGCEPVRGDLTMWYQFFGFVCTGLTEEQRKWLEQWLAYPIARPGTKLFTAVLIQSHHKGVGKSGLGYTMKELYGENWNKISDTDLNANFNGHFLNKQFIMGDEIAANNKRGLSDKMKALITQQELSIEQKYMERYTIDDVINYLFTSNHSDAIYLEDGDRRYFIHSIKCQPMPDEWYIKYFKWLRYEGGKEALLYHFMNDVNFTGFNPTAKAMDTSAKEIMTDFGRSGLSTWVRALKSNPDDVLKDSGLYSGCYVMTVKDILRVYDPEGNTGTKESRMGTELSNQGFEILLNAAIKYNGTPVKFFIVKESNEIRRFVKGPEITRFYDAQFDLLRKTRKY